MKNPKFKIDYVWNNRKEFEITRATLISEGWRVINQTYPGIPEQSPGMVCTCWFEREF